MNSEKPNRLAHEKSPYLLQHAHNPVDWFPWGDEAFAKAKAENKPIFLSIGYSTCHWCHVMERESFEDDYTAKILNDHFVSIKVDREERPDIDSIYMSVVMALTGSGGWPMTVFLTPDQKPFYGGTYFPPTPRWGSPGFTDLLHSIHQNWKSQEDKIRESGQSIVSALQERLRHVTIDDELIDQGALQIAYSELQSNFDSKNGGFGSSPKFPMGHTLSFLLRYGKYSNEDHALAMVEKTLSAMAGAGIYDQLGGGFHRYSTDAIWQVPHFEKMLYDQALLVKVYLEAYLITGDSIYARAAAETLEYVLRDMHDQQGGFYSAEDADSLEPGAEEGSEKKEGAFYLWTQRELAEVLTPEEFKFVQFYFGIEQGGNAQFDPHGELIGKNILHGQHDYEETARHLNISVEEGVKLLASAKEKLFAIRAQRPRPHLDDKILVDWNGLMISAFAMAGRILENGRYIQAAEAASQFILKKLRRADGRLLHRYRDGEAAILANLDDYAFFVQGLLDVYENSFDPEYFSEALRLNQEMLDLFWDDRGGGLFLTPKDGEPMIVRPKEVYDGAVPSGNSVAALNLLRIYHFTFDEKYLKKSEMIFRAFQPEVSNRPSVYSQMLMALQFFLGPVKEIVIAGDVSEGAGRDMLTQIFRVWIPQKVLIVKSPAVSERIVSLMPFTKDQNPAGKVTQVFMCENQTCQNPVKSLDELKEVL